VLAVHSGKIQINGVATEHPMIPPIQSGATRVWVKRSLWMLPLLVLIGFAVLLIVRPSQRTRLRESFQVSQRGREFKPGLLNVRQGDTVRIVNDDDDLSHHAYVASERFKFDSGDQAPGANAEVTFTVPGTFNVLCGIHPKMRLVVNVK
jgi:plastocyanin